MMPLGSTARFYPVNVISRSDGAGYSLQPFSSTVLLTLPLDTVRGVVVGDRIEVELRALVRNTSAVSQSFWFRPRIGAFAPANFVRQNGSVFPQADPNRAPFFPSFSVHFLSPSRTVAMTRSTISTLPSSPNSSPNGGGQGMVGWYESALALTGDVPVSITFSTDNAAGMDIEVLGFTVWHFRVMP